MMKHHCNKKDFLGPIQVLSDLSLTLGEVIFGQSCLWVKCLQVRNFGWGHFGGRVFSGIVVSRQGCLWVRLSFGYVVFG